MKTQKQLDEESMTRIKQSDPMGYIMIRSANAFLVGAVILVVILSIIALALGK